MGQSRAGLWQFGLKAQQCSRAPLSAGTFLPPTHTKVGASRGCLQVWAFKLCDSFAAQRLKISLRRLRRASEFDSASSLVYIISFFS